MRKRPSLMPVDLDPLPALPARLQRVVEEADKAADAFIERTASNPVPGFVPSDFALTARALIAIKERSLAPGLALCEWGSGVGGVVVAASILGFDAVGIEIDVGLVDSARGLARTVDAPGARFVLGSFVPDGADTEVESTDEIVWLVSGGADAHAEMGVGIDDFDVIFAYPWPGEESVIINLFEDQAAAGALLVTYNGVEGMRAVRKARRR
ncbi:MAG: hypothetical protein ACKVZJ_10725 [Phycisphaerales bacterium]